MKSLNRIICVAVFAAMFSLTSRVAAQYRGDDGIIASPKARQFLNEGKKVASTPPISASVGYRETGGDVIVTSPKFRQFLNEHRTVPSTSAAVAASTGYSSVGDDGIAASPKLRQQSNERGSQLMVAPMKMK